MTTGSSTSTGGVGRSLDRMLVHLMRTPIRFIHPRRANRTLPLWDSAVTVRTDQKIPSVFQTLIDENILSAPVLTAEGRCCGFIEMMDLVTYTVGLFNSPIDTELREFFTKSRTFRDATVLDVMEGGESSERLGGSSWRPFTVGRDYSMMHALEILARTQQHRVAVTMPPPVAPTPPTSTSAPIPSTTTVGASGPSTSAASGSSTSAASSSSASTASGVTSPQPAPGPTPTPAETQSSAPKAIAVNLPPGTSCGEPIERVVGVITESMMIGFLYVNLEKLGPAKDTPVSEMVSHYFVLSVSETDTAIRAFRLMVERKVSGLAVVDADGRLTDTISVRDLKGIGTEAEMFTRLWDSVAEFKKWVKTRTPHCETLPRQPVVVLPTTTLDQVIRLMETEAVHRLFVVRTLEDRRPINVISQADVLKFILPY